jgi:hypothetical protein
MDRTRIALTLLHSSGTWLALIVTVGVLFGAAAGFATNPVFGTGSPLAAGLNAGLLAATLVAVVWYSLETHRLLGVQRDAAEISEHPWLEVSPWPDEEIIRRQTLAASLRVKNVGHAPALIRRVGVTEPKESERGNWTVGAKGDDSPRALAPGQSYVVTIVELGTADGAAAVCLDVSFDYGTVHGGRGWLLLRFRYKDRQWKSRETRYEIELSSGRRLPRGIGTAE